MPNLPPPSRLSLSAALDEIARAVAALSGDVRVTRSLYDALCEGKFAATGDFETGEGRRLAREQPVLPEDWRNHLSESEFAAACHRERVMQLKFAHTPSAQIWLVKVTIATQDIAGWLAPPAASGSAKAERECAAWLRALAQSGELFRRDRDGTQRTKSGCLAEAQKRWAKPRLSARAFERAWANVAAAYPAMRAAGRKPK